ncbi:MAG: DUF58 domain-containing protein [Candidatus Delongbacteria bacterium]|nr:DUF58 domain-containing protein [Candidatus Delongbacteria bacterium]
MNTLLLPEHLQKLRNLELIARQVVEGFITGRHRSPYHGFSVEFAEHRQYMPGDSVRHIDWKVYGKTQRYYIKQFEEDTNLKSWILLDTSASMFYGSGSITKFTYASYLAAALTYLMLKQRDAVGLMLFDNQIREQLAPRSVWSWFYQILDKIDQVTPGTTTDLSASLHNLAESIKRRGLIILISDLFDDDEKLLSALRHFRHRKHEVIVFQVLDPQETAFDFRRETKFRDLETGELLNTQPLHIRDDVLQAVGDFIRNFQQNCREHRIDHVLMDTNTPFDQALYQYLLKRGRLY